MQYTALGAAGVKVSRLCFGTMLFGKESDEATSAAIFKRLRDAGVNFFDCANVYAGGRSEEVLGGLIADCRDEVVITSKCTMPTGKDDPNARGSSRRHIMLAVEASLRRLKTDRIDVYFMHHRDPDTPMDETLRALDDLVSQGKILYPGVSNWPAWEIAKSRERCDRQGWVPFAVAQPMYNLLKRQAEVELLPMAEAEGVGVIPYSPTAGGLLTGKYGKDRKAEEGSRHLTNAMYQQRYRDEWMLDAAERITAFARERGWHPVSLAIAWVASHPGVTAPIIGARNLEQLEPALQALGIGLTADLRAEVSALTPTPPPATDRSEEVS